MRSEEESREGGRAGAHEGVLAEEAQVGKAMPRGTHETHGIPQRTLAVNNVGANGRSERQKTSEKSVKNSRIVTRIREWSEQIGEGIIGRRVSVGGTLFGCSGVGSELALVNEPTSDIGGAGFFKPLIQKNGDFFAQIGGVGEAREFIGLQSIARGGEKELPGRLGAGLRHENLRRPVSHEYANDITSQVISIETDMLTEKLWKSVEKQENVAGCCSGCAGDYEDPDCTAWDADVEGDAEDTGDRTNAMDEDESREG